MNNKKKTIRKLAVVSGFGIGMITVAGSAIYACEEETDPVLVSDASVEIASEKMAGDPGDKVPDQSEKETPAETVSSLEDQSAEPSNESPDPEQETEDFRVDESILWEVPENNDSENSTVDLKTGAMGGPILENGNYQIFSSLNPDKSIDVAGGAKYNGGNVQIYDNNESNAQIWKLEYNNADGFYSIQNIGSGKYLDVTGAKVANGSNIQQYTGNGTKAQKWQLVQTNAGYKIVSALNNAYVIDLAGANTSNGANIQLYQNNNTKAQSWVFWKVIDQIAYLDQLASQNKNVLKDGSYTIRNVGTGKYMNVNQSSSGANVNLVSSANQDSQKWQVQHDGKGYVTLINLSSGKVLDVTGASSTNGTNVQQYAGNGTRAQKWVAVKNGEAYHLVSALTSRVRLNANGSNVDIELNKGTNAVQAWIFASTLSTRDTVNQVAASNKGSISDGFYEIQSGINSKFVLDVTAAVTEVGTNVQLYSANGTNAQKYKIVTDGLGYSTIMNVHSKKYLGVASGARNGSNLQLSDHLADQWNEKWIFGKNSDGTYRIMSALNTAFVIDVLSGIGANGQNVQIYQSNGTNAQKFKLVKQNMTDQSTQFSNSNLAYKWVPAHTNNYTVGREGCLITNITIHHMDGRATAESCGGVFQNPNRETSAHYGIGYNGEICQYVAEKDTAWANANWESNKHSVTIENSDWTLAPEYKITDATLNSLIRLVADIASRNHLGKLIYGQNINVHGDVAATSCPGPYIRQKLSQIIASSNKLNGFF